MRNDPLETTVADYIETHQLLDKASTHLVALSGGADSVALLLTLHALDYRLEAIHCNFQLRGTEADRDETFCQKLCQRLGIPLHRAHFDTRAYAQLHGISIEMAARKLRYAYFQQLQTALQAASICVAHHRDDSVETILLNLIRGTGIHGLTGIKPKNGAVVRPFLCVNRKEIVDYLQRKKQPYVTDSSNLVADVKRNKIRLQVLPLLEELNPSLRSTLMTMADEMADVEKVVNQSLAHYAEAQETNLATLKKEPSLELALYYFLQPHGFTSAQIRQIATTIDTQSGRRWLSPTHELLCDRGRLTLYPIEDDAPKPMRVPETGRYAYANEATLRISRKPKDEDFAIPKAPDTAAVDGAKVRFPLTIRRATQGDRFVPLGMEGFKLVSDFLTNQKKSVWEKRHQLVVCDAEGHIVWLVGNRLDHRARITDETTQVLLLEKLAGLP